MSQWAERITGHQVWKQLQALGPAIDQGVAREGVDAGTVDGLERLRAVLTFVGKRLAAADPATTSPGPLDQIASAMQSATTEVQAFVADGTAGHIANANNHGDTALVHLTQVAVPSTARELAGLKDAAVAYRASLETQIKGATAASAGLASDADSLRAKLAEIGNEMTAERARLSQLTSDFQSQFSTAQETRNLQYTEAQGARQEKFQSLVADFTTRLTEQNADFGQQKEAALKQYREDIGLLKNEYAAAAKTLLDQIEDHRQRVEKLVGVIADLGITSGYHKTANYARKALWIWQGVTVLALVAVITFAYREIILFEGQFSWPALGGRIFLSLTVAVLAAYAASQADKYIEMERRNRKLALELEAIGPYLAPLKQEEQDKFRLALGDKTFGREEPTHGKHGERSPATVVDVFAGSKGMKEFLEQITELVKEARK